MAADPAAAAAGGRHERPGKASARP